MATKMKTDMPARGRIEIRASECKGCGLCIAVCPVTVLNFAETLNIQGYRPVVYLGKGCTGCGICFYVCPEPGAITVFRRETARTPFLPPAKTQTSAQRLGSAD